MMNLNKYIVINIRNFTIGSTDISMRQKVHLYLFRGLKTNSQLVTEFLEIAILKGISKYK